MFDGQNILLTGGTGSFGRAFTRTVLDRYDPERVIIYSRDELKQSQMMKEFGDDSALRFFIGDVRDGERLRRAMGRVDTVIHAAAMKQVPACEYNPIEAIKTNVHGAENIINAAVDTGVENVLALSTDKAVNPVNLYGATKLVAEKLFVQGNVYDPGQTRMSCVRYGNVLGSRGSVVPLFREQRKTGRITVTDKNMTRFWLTLQQGVDFVLTSTEQMRGGEIFVPRVPSMRIMDLVEAVAPECEVETIGIRPGEKLHEVLLSEDEARHAKNIGDRYLIEPEHDFWASSKRDGTPLPTGFSYRSDNNTEWLRPEQLQDLLQGDS